MKKLNKDLTIEEFKKHLVSVVQDGQTVNLKELFQLITESEDPEILGLVNDLIFNRIDYYEDQLLKELKNSHHYMVKATIMNCLLINPSPKAINKVTQHYFHNEDDRPIINKRLFFNKEILANALNIYCNTKKLTLDEIEIIKRLLRTVPRERILDINQISRSKLFSIYQCIEPKKRYESIHNNKESKNIDDTL